MPASQNFVMAKGRNASAAIAKKRFVKVDAAAADGETVKQCDTLGEKAYGVSKYGVSAAELLKGKGVSVLTDGRAIVEASGALAVGTLVTTDANGMAIAAVAGNWIAGMVDEPAGGVNQECSVDLSKGGGKL
jgi:hypothetical protein